MKTVLLVAAVLLASCSHVSARRFVGPRGEPMAYASCGSSPPLCYDLARQECGGDYDVVERQRETNQISTASVEGHSGYAVSGPVTTNELIVICRDPTAAAAALDREKSSGRACTHDGDCAGGLRCGYNGQCESKP